MNGGPTGTTMACLGDSQKGHLPKKFSVRIAMERSTEPRTALRKNQCFQLIRISMGKMGCFSHLWMMTGGFFSPFSSTYPSLKRRGSWKSSWMVAHCGGKPFSNSKLTSFPTKMEFSFSHLVLPLEGVCERDVDLWPVECPVARVKLPLKPGVVQGVAQGLTRKHTNW